MLGRRFVQYCIYFHSTTALALSTVSSGQSVDLVKIIDTYTMGTKRSMLLNVILNEHVPHMVNVRYVSCNLLLWGDHKYTNSQISANFYLTIVVEGKNSF